MPYSLVPQSRPVSLGQPGMEQIIQNRSQVGGNKPPLNPYFEVLTSSVARMTRQPKYGNCTVCQSKGHNQAKFQAWTLKHQKSYVPRKCSLHMVHGKSSYTMYTKFRIWYTEICLFGGAIIQWTSGGYKLQYLSTWLVLSIVQKIDFSLTFHYELHHAQI